jgi:hypothetical protein
MSETTTETPTHRYRTVRKYRHEATDTLTEARSALVVPDLFSEVTSLLNGSISSILSGRPGMGPEAQVEYLTRAEEKVRANAEEINVKITAAKEALANFSIDNVEESVSAAIDKVLATLAEAKDLAATRDFEDHQNRKSRAGGYEAYEPLRDASPEDGEPSDEEGTEDEPDEEDTEVEE